MTERAAMDANAPSNECPAPSINQETGKNTNMVTCIYNSTFLRMTYTTTARTVLYNIRKPACTNVVWFFSMPHDKSRISTSLPSEKRIQIHVSELRESPGTPYSKQKRTGKIGKVNLPEVIRKLMAPPKHNNLAADHHAPRTHARA